MLYQHAVLVSTVASFRQTESFVSDKVPEVMRLDISTHISRSLSTSLHVVGSDRRFISLLSFHSLSMLISVSYAIVDDFGCKG